MTDRNAPLALDPATFRALGHRLVDTIAERLSAIPDGPVTPGETPAEVRAALGLGGGLPEEGEDPGALLERTARLLFDHSLFNGHPKFFGYITSSPAPIGMLGDLLAAAVNPNVGGFMLSPAATEIEAETVRWIAELIGYPTSTGGLLVSGGNMANFVGFFAARVAQSDWEIRAQGSGVRRLRAYVSGETHTWIQKAADLSGIGTDAVRWIETGADQRMNLEALKRAIDADRAAGDMPFLVVGTAGSVSTGAVDDLPAIAALCKAEKLWFHVDGAYGGFAAAVPDAPPELRGLALADSVAVDPHKWLYAPLEAGCGLVRDPARLIAAFSYHPPYYHLDEALNFVDFGMQNSRGFRALKVWLQLRQVGAAGYRQMIGDDIKLARVLYEAVVREPELEPFTCALSIATFRFVPADLEARLAAGETRVVEYVDELSKALLVRLQKGGEAFVSNAVLGGRYVLRACIVNFRTQRADVEALPGIVVRTGRSVDAGMRPADL